MSNAIVGMFFLAIMLVAMVTMAGTGFYSMDTITQSWKDMEDRTGDTSRTDISNLAENSCDGANVTITLKNDGEIPLTDFVEWDVVVQYYASGSDYIVKYLAYDSTAPPGDNEWTVEGIYLDASGSTAEVYEPNLFNPGEEMKISIKLNPAVANGTTNMVTVSTPTGVTAEVMFDGP